MERVSFEEIDLDSQIVDMHLDPRGTFVSERHRQSQAVAGAIRCGDGRWQPCRVTHMVTMDGVPVGVHSAHVAGELQPTREAALLVAREHIRRYADHGR